VIASKYYLGIPKFQNCHEFCFFILWVIGLYESRNTIWRRWLCCPQ